MSSVPTLGGLLLAAAAFSIACGGRGDGPGPGAAVVKAFVGLRVTDQVEREGLDLALHGETLQ